MTPIDVTLRRAADYELVWDVQDWLPRSTIGLVVSPPGAYKTWCMLDLAVSVATGKPFLGHLPILNTGPVFIFQQEDSRYSLMDRLAIILQARFGAGVVDNDDGWDVMTPPSGIPIWVHEHRQLQFDREQSAERFMREVEKVRPQLVIIDPLYMAAGQDSSFMAETVQNLKLLKDLRDSYGTSFMIVHHTRKNAGNTPGRMDVWGSQFLNAFLETGWQIRPVFVGEKKGEQFSTKAVRLERHFKDADSEHTPLYLQFNISEEGYIVEMLEDVTEIKQKSVSDRELLRQFEMPNTISQAARDSGLDKSTVSRRVSKWRGEGVIKEIKQGKNTRYVSTQPVDESDMFEGD
jgi:RecA-family ATPase